jgi:hypothetical protein
MSEENKALARRSWEIVENLDAIEEIYAPDVVWHEPDRDLRGHEQARQFVTTYKTALPDLNVTVEDVIAEGQGEGHQVEQERVPSRRRRRARDSTYPRLDESCRWAHRV